MAQFVKSTSIVKWKLVLVFILIAVSFLQPACAPPELEEESCNFVTNELGQRVSWAGRLPVILHVHDSVPPQVVPAIESSIVIWNEAFGMEAFVLGGWVSGEGSPQVDNQNVIYWMSSWDPKKPREQGRTVINHVGKRIFDADIAINGSYFRRTPVVWDPSQNVSAREIDGVSFITHELGHVIGQEHGDSHVHESVGGIASRLSSEEQESIQMPRNSVMFATISLGEVRREITDYDLRSLRCEYN